MPKTIIQIYDPVMNCSSGLCATGAMGNLQEVIHDLKNNYAEKVEVERYMLSTHPMKFMNNPIVADILQNEGPDQLPIVTVFGKMLSKKGYPTKDQIMEHINNN